MSNAVLTRGRRLGLVLLFALLAVPAAAQEFLGRQGDWNVIAYVENDVKYCYVHSEPVKQEGNYAKRGQPYVLVLRTKGGNDQVSVASGYPYKDGSEVEVKIGDRAVAFFTKGDKAWARTTDEDAAMVKAMQVGATMTVRGTSQKGTYSLDTYSLKGFTAAHKQMAEACK